MSTALIQLGRATGMRVWVTGRSEGKRARARSLGAHETFEPGARLRERVDAVFKTVGKAHLVPFGESTQPGGISDAKQAFTAMLDGDTAGKIVFTR